MTYFLDFDRTLFDTSAFLAYLIQRDGLSDFNSKTEVEMAATLNTMTAAGKLHFKDGELGRFLYPDAVSFLDAHVESCVVVTAGNVALQKAKLENVFDVYPQLQLVYTGDDRKGPFLVQLTAVREKPWVFVDDKPMELGSVATMAPGVSLYEMRRDGEAGSGAYPVLRSFADLA